MRAALALAVIAFPLAARAQTRDVPYFINHAAEGRATVQACRANAAYSKLPTCRNAERAASLSDLQQVIELHRAGAQQAAAMPFDPAYWSRNPIARAGELEQCRRQAPGDEMALPYCKAAAASALRDIARR